MWNANPEVTHIFGSPSFSTTDAPFFLSEAKMVAQPHSNFSEFKRLRAYPSNKDIPLIKHEQDVSDLLFSVVSDRDSVFICNLRTCYQERML